jgi:hypothetical protein
MNGGVQTDAVFFYGGGLVGYSMARQIAAARSGSLVSRTAVDSTCAAVTPNVLRIESRWLMRVAESAEPMGNFRNATIVRTNVESLISAKMASRPHAVAINRVPAATERIRGFNERRVNGSTGERVKG